MGQQHSAELATASHRIVLPYFNHYARITLKKKKKKKFDVQLEREVPSALLQPMDRTSSSALSRMRKKIFSLSPNRFLSYPQTGFQLETSEKKRRVLLRPRPFRDPLLLCCLPAAQRPRGPPQAAPGSRLSRLFWRERAGVGVTRCGNGRNGPNGRAPRGGGRDRYRAGLPPGSAAGSSRLGPAGSRRPRVRQGRGLGAASKWRPRATATTAWRAACVWSQLWEMW